MRILIVSQYFWPEEFRINDIAEGLVERGYEVTVLTGFPNYPKGQLEKGYSWLGPYSESFGGVKIIRVPLITRGKGKSLRLVFNYISFVLTASLAGPIFCKGKFDAIFVYQPSPVTVGIPARILGKIKKAPILFWVQDLWPESLTATNAIKSGWIIKKVGHLVRWIYKGCHKILVQSKAFVEPVQKMGVAKNNIYYFPNSAEAFYQPEPAETQWNGPELPEGFRVMFAGNIGKAQSFETILSAAEILMPHKHIQWVIVGDGREIPWLRREIEQRGLHKSFHLMGRHPVETMPLWFSQADVMLASLSKDPIFSMTIPAKVQSYLACGRPIIASIDGEGSRIVEESNSGIGVGAQDSKALADAVLAMSRMTKAEREAMGKNAHQYFQTHFSRERLLDRLEGWFKEVSEGGK